MPVPPYGSRDISGSDTASKLIVNQPNGKVEAAITGVMNGLDPNTEYTVFLSNEYEPYVETGGWNVEGDWTCSFFLSGGAGPYNHHMTVISQDILTGVLSGNGYWIGHLSYTWDILGSSTVTSSTFILNNLYTGSNPGYSAHWEADINSSGELVNGTWSAPGQTGTWSSTSGSATKTYTGNTGWSGLFTSTLPAFTFTTDEFGSSSWHINMRDDDFPGPGTHTLSVWINDGGTLLISDNFDVEVD